MKQLLRHFAGIFPCLVILLGVSMIVGSITLPVEEYTYILFCCTAVCAVGGFLLDKVLSRLPSAWTVFGSLLLGGVIGFFWLRTIAASLFAKILLTICSAIASFIGARYSSAGYYEATNSGKILLSYIFMVVSSIFLWLRMRTGCETAQGHLVFLGYGILCWLIISLILWADHSLMSALHSDDTDTAPPSVKKASVLFTGGFAALVLFFAFFQKLRDWISALILHTKEIIKRNIERNLTITDLPDTMNQGMSMIGDGAPSEPWEGWKVIFVVLLLAVIIVFIYLIVLAVKNNLPDWIEKIKRLFERLRNSWTQEDQGYTDSAEDLLSWDQLKERGKEIRTSFLKRFARKKRYSDCSDDTQRLRYLFASLLVKLNKSGELTPGLTPQEIAGKYENLDEFCAAYGQVRYGEIPATAAQVENGKKSVNRVKPKK